MQCRNAAHVHLGGRFIPVELSACVSVTAMQHSCLCNIKKILQVNPPIVYNKIKKAPVPNMLKITVLQHVT